MLLIEAGRDTPPGAVPEDIADTFPRSYSNPQYMWPSLSAYLGAVGLKGAQSDFPQARVMGGGSSVMGMIALRGLPDDYDGWQRDGANGWGWSDVLPFFRRLESDSDFHGPLHGRDGPVAIRRHPFDQWPPFCQAIAQAAERRGYRFIQDMNGDFGDGYAALPLSSTPTERISAASAYLDVETRRRRNLLIACEVMAERLLFEGNTCVGLIAINDRERKRYAGRRVIVSAGAIQSPSLLLRSGIGPPDHLQALGIPVIHSLVGVGANLQNHPVLYLATHLKKFARQSPSIRPHFISALRFSSDESSGMRGDMVMLALNKSSWHGVGQAVAGLGIGLNRPFSRGSVRLRSPHPQDQPNIHFEMLTDDRDYERMVVGLRLALDLMQDEVVRPLRHELFTAAYTRTVRRLNKPGISSALTSKFLASLLDGPNPLRRYLIRNGARGEADETHMRNEAWLRETVRACTFGMYHPAGTCKMGRNEDPTAVVDSQCNVRGINSLSVVDASVMPTLIRGNTNVPTLMIAERAADILLRQT